MKKYLALALLATICFSCNKAVQTTEPKTPSETTIDDLIDNLEDPNNNEVIVVAHRGDWRNAPENSLQAIQYCIDIGVDMVEIDVRETKDGQLVLMHDETIDRTTTGTGPISGWTFDSLMTLKLKDGSGVATAHKIPTLEEALLLAKDKILINLDKSYSIFDKCYEVAERTGTTKQVIVKGDRSLQQVRDEFGEYLDKIYWMPVIRLPSPNDQSIVEDYLTDFGPVAIEFVFASDTLPLIEEFKEIRERGTGIWVNSLWPELNGGHDDEKAALDPSVYDWYLENGVDIIQTDRPRILIRYLQGKGVHR